MAIIRGGVGTAELNVLSGSAQVVITDSSGVSISTPDGASTSNNAGGIPIAGKNDGNVRVVRVDRFGGLASAQNQLLLYEPFEGTTQSTNRWVNTLTTHTVAQTAIGLTLNSGNSLAANTNATITSFRQFARYQRAPIQAKFRLRAAHQTNAVMEWGFGAQTGATPQAIGAYFQITTGGALQGVLTFNGVDQTTTPITLPGGWQTNFYTYDIVIDDDDVKFYVQDSSSGQVFAERSISLSVTQSRLWNATRLPVFVREFIGGTAASAAPIMIVAGIDVIQLDQLQNKPWAHTVALNGQGSQIVPTTFAQSITWANSAAPANSTLSNTAAGATTLGGLFQFAAVAGAATDYALFGFQVPAPYTFVCTGVDIDVWNTGAAVATTPTLMVWGLGVDQSAVSLATAGIQRVALGVNSLPIGAAIGAPADRRISADFTHSPLVTNPSRFMTVILRMPVGTATASQVVQGLVTVKGYYE